MSTPSSKTLIDDTTRAVKILDEFTAPNSGGDLRMIIPHEVMANARGIVFVRFYRGSLVFSAKKGSGIIIARLPNGEWSAPSSVLFAGVGIGHDIGIERIDSIIVLTYDGAVRAFYEGGGQMQVGISASLAVGPLGRGGDFAVSTSNGKNIAATYYYSIAKGISIGCSLEGSKITERQEVNEAFYGQPITAKEILTGLVPQPQMAAQLYAALGFLRAGSQCSQMHTSPLTPTPSGMLSRESHRPEFSPSASAHSVPTSNFSEKNPGNVSYNHAEIRPPPSYNEVMASGTPSSSSVPTQSTVSITCYKPDENDAPVEPRVPMQAGSPAKTPTGTPAETPTGFSAEPPAGTPAGSPARTPTGTPAENAAGNSAGTSQEPAPGHTPGPSAVRALYPFTSQDPSDLSFKSGDIIIVTKSSNDRQSWWQGEIGSRSGQFPANYTEDLE